MKFTTFKTLPNRQKQDVLWAKGVPVAYRRTENLHYMLFQIDAFYMEVGYCLKNEAIKSMKAFEDMKRLEPYLKLIQLPSIFNY